jgi:hypothetical protein
MGNSKGIVKILRIGQSAAKHPERRRSKDEGSETREMSSLSNNSLHECPVP